MSRITRKINAIFTIPIGARVTLTPKVSDVRLYLRSRWARFDSTMLTMQQFILVDWVQGFLTQPGRYFQYGIVPADSSDDEEGILYVTQDEIQIVESQPVVQRRLTVRACDV